MSVDLFAQARCCCGRMKFVTRFRGAHHRLMENSPPVDKTIIAHHNITSVIRAKGRLDDTASPDSTEKIREQLRAQAGRLLLSELVRVDVVVLVCLATGLVPGFEELWDIGVVEHAGHHVLEVIAPWRVVESLGYGQDFWIPFRLCLRHDVETTVPGAPVRVAHAREPKKTIMSKGVSPERLGNS